ncbi:MAG: hypothetical protein ABIN95_07095 [Mucilaginibacter sp.]
MIEYSRHIKEYLNHYYSSFSKIIPLEKWGNTKLAEKYMQKYWLNEKLYTSKWKPLQDKIFIQNTTLPDLIFRSEFKVEILRGGCLFIEEDFKQLQKIMQELGEKKFVVIQSSQEYTAGEPMFRMEFPVNITWPELMSGNYISAVLFEMSYNEYFVFGESGNWGKYSASDYIYPLDIIAYKAEWSFVFKKCLKQSAEEQKEISEWYPSKYKQLLNNH